MGEKFPKRFTNPNRRFGNKIPLAKLQHAMKPSILGAACATILLSSQFCALRADEKANKPSIDIVFAIDCSGSMGGVIETAKQKVWDVVNTVATAKPSPRLRIGLLAYGDGDRTWRRFDLSDDLDTVYGNLTKFRDEGWGDEFVGQAVQKSLREMTWTKARSGEKSVRLLYMVGNETAAQGEISYKKTAPLAKNFGVTVHAVYCGSSGGQETWQEMARLGGGKYLTIAGDGASVMIPTPYDAQMSALSRKLNTTYLAYGVQRRARAQNQVAQDSASSSVGGSYASAARANAKTTSQYNNSGWDLVDKARDDKKFDVSKVPAPQLPPEMQKMSAAQKKAWIAKKQAERAGLQKQIQALNVKRSQFLRAANAKKGRKDSLDAALLGSVRESAIKKGFRFGSAKK